MISVPATSLRTASIAPDDLRSSTRLFLPTLSWPKAVEQLFRSGGRLRMVSPSTCSILMTSAPMSASILAQCGPAIVVEKSRTRWPSMAEIPLLVVNVQRGGPSTGLPTNVEQSDLYQAIFGSHGDSPRVVLAAATVEDCFYVALEAARIARKFSTPVFILSDGSLATRIEAFNEPDLQSVMQDPKLDLSPR